MVPRMGRLLQTHAHLRVMLRPAEGKPSESAPPAASSEAHELAQALAHQSSLLDLVHKHA